MSDKFHYTTEMVHLLTPLTVDRFGAYLSYALHMFGQMLMEHLLPDASWMEGL